VASSKDRARKLARAKLDRQLTRRAEAVRKRRQLRAGVSAALALLLIGFGAFWLLGGFDGEKAKPLADQTCLWTPQDGTANANLRDVGVPPGSGMPTAGTRPMTVTMNGKPVTIELDLANAPCAAASFAHLSGKGFFDNTKCHELKEGALRCGDPSGTGLGGPTYTFAGENVPSAPEAIPTATPSAGASASPAPPGDQPPLYPKGTVAMVNAPAGNGSQFLIFYQDFNPTQPDYSIVGQVTGGLDVIEQIAKAGAVDNGSGQQVKPKNDVVIQSLTVGEPNASTPTTPPSATSAPAASPSASAAS
jgi:peptidyl-prolyl cis-trans isomerase B (cyclophilin B)